MSHNGNKERERPLGAWRKVVTLVSALAIAIIGVMATGTAPAAAVGSDTMTVHVKQSSLTDHASDCSTTGNASGQLNVTDPTNANADSIVVTTNQGTYTAADVSFKMVGNVLQIRVPLGTDEFITDATIQVNSAWTGQFVLSHYDCVPPPTVVPVPPAPGVNDACGPNNATWIVPADDDTYHWTLQDGDLVVTIVAEHTTFPDGSTTHDYGTAPDSNEACPLTNATPAAYTVSPATCTTNGSLSIPAQPEGVVVTVNGETVTTPFTTSTPGSYDVVYSAAAGFQLTSNPSGTAVVDAQLGADKCPVLNATGSASADCTGLVTAHLDNSGSNVPATYELDVTGAASHQYTVAAGSKKTVHVQGTNGGSFTLWGPDDVKLDHGTIPRACAVLHPAGHINCRCSGTVVFYLNNTHSNRAVTYHETIAGKSWNVRVGAGQKLVNERHGAAHARVRLGALGKTLDTARIPAKCTPPNQPPPTGEKHATGGKVVSGKA